MTGYVRVTIISDQRNAEMLLPSDRQVAELMPEVLRSLDPASSPETPRALSLTPVGAATLTPHQSLDQAGVTNGALLALDRRDEAVPRPIIYDMAEETEQLPAPTVGRLEVDLRRLITIAVFVLFGLTTLVIGMNAFDVAEPAWWSLGTAAAALGGLAAIPTERLRWDAELLLLGAGSLVVSLYWGIPEVSWGLPDVGGSAWFVPLWILLALICWLISRRLWFSTLTTLSAAAILFGLWWGSSQVFGAHREIVAVAGIGTVVLLGLSPRLALTTSGMHRLDDAVSSGERPPIPRARQAFLNAHAGLGAAVVLCAGSVLLAVDGLTDRGIDRWTLPVAVLLAGLTALRARSMPLALERAALLGSASVSAVLILRATAEHIPTWVLICVPAAVALLPLLLQLVTVPPHTGARLRIYARRLEGLATLALIPLLLGLFGIYSQLIDTFQE